MRLLLVEDNVALADSLCALLKRAGYAVDWRADGRDALILGEQEPYDLCVLDLGLPGLGGLDILASWRRRDVATPVLVLSAKGNWSERVDGLRAGADDYLGKPFHHEELLLRLQALLRRSHGLKPEAELCVGGFALDEARQQIRLEDGSEHSLSATEFKLLRYFMLHPGQILSKSRLAEHLYDYETERDSNVIEVQINHLRRKLGRDVIATHRGQGYRFPGEAA